MIHPTKTHQQTGFVFGFLVYAAGALTASVASAEATLVSNAVKMHLEQSELRNLAKGFGEELALSAVTGHLPGPVNGNLGFAEVSAVAIKYSLNIVSASAKFNGSTGIASRFVAENLIIEIERLNLNAAGTIFCNNLRITSGTGMIPISMNLQPVVADKTLRLNPDQIHIDVNTSNFHADKPGTCKTPWGFNWLVKKITPWAVNAIQSKIATAVGERVSELIDEKTQQINQTLMTSFDLPFAIEGKAAVYANIVLTPDQVNITGTSADLTLTAEIEMSEDPVHQEPATGSTELRSNPFSPLSWVRISEDLLTSFLREANTNNLLSLTFNHTTIPSMGSVLDATALVYLIPDAATRFNGNEDVEIKLGKARDVRVIFEPNGPGGIPIIDFVLQQVPVEVNVDGESYFTTKNNVKFRFHANINEQTQTLALSLVDVDCDVREFAFNRTLYPKPMNRKFDSKAFVSYLHRFTNRPQRDVAVAGLSLPEIALGTYRFVWSGAQVNDKFLTIRTTVAK